MGALHNFLRNNFREGEWVGRVCGPRWGNRVANILQDLQGVNCKIQKPTNQEGRGWRIIVDGTSDAKTDIPAPWAEGIARASVALGPDYTDGGTTIPFSTLDHHTNDDILLPNDDDEDGKWESISVLKSGIYTVSIAASWTITAGVGVNGVTASARSSDDTNLVSCGFSQDDIESTSGGTGVFLGVGGQSGNFYLASGETIDVDVTGPMAGIRLSVSLYQLYTAPTA